MDKDGQVVEEPGALLCINPISYRHDEIAVAAKEGRGAIFLDAAPPLVARGFASAQCRGGTLEIAEIGDVPRDFMSSLLDRALGRGNFHPIEYQLFLIDIRHNAEVRIEAWRRRHGQ